MEHPTNERERQAAAVAAIRKLSTTQYLTATTLESLAAALVISPGLFLWYGVEGALTARYPRPVPGMVIPPIPQTFGGLLSAGLKYSLSCTSRTVLWFGMAAAGATITKELFKAGPRYQAGPAAVQSPIVMLANGGAGALAAYLLMMDWKMVPTRRALYVAVGGAGGLALPLALGLYGPLVRAKLMQHLPQPAKDKSSGSPPSAPLQ